MTVATDITIYGPTSDPVSVGDLATAKAQALLDLIGATPVSNGQWLTAAGGVMVWSDLPTLDLIPAAVDDVDMAGNLIVNLAPGVAGTDAVNKSQIPVAQLPTIAYGVPVGKSDLSGWLCQLLLDASIDPAAAVQAVKLFGHSSVLTANTTLVSGTSKMWQDTNSSGGAFTLTLPASPVNGEMYYVMDSNGSLTGSHTVTVDPGSNTIEGAAGTIVMSKAWARLGLRWNGSTWIKWAFGLSATVPNATGSPSAGTSNTQAARQDHVHAQLVTIVTGQNGTISATETSGADGIASLPYDMTVTDVVVTCKTAPTGAMAVQVTKSTNHAPPSWSNVSGATVTFSANDSRAVVSGLSVNLSKYDLLNFDVTALGSGTNMLVEVIGVTR